MAFDLFKEKKEYLAAKELSNQLLLAERYAKCKEVSDWLAREAPHDSLRARALLNWALASFELYEELEPGQARLSEAADIFEGLRNWNEAEKALNWLYDSYEWEGKYQEAMDLAWRAQHFTAQRPEQIHDNHSNIGYFHQRLGNIDSAEHHFRIALENRKKYQRWDKVMSNFDNLYFIYRNYGTAEQVWELLLEKESFSRERNNPLYLAKTYKTFGDYLISLSDYELSANYYLQSYELLDSIAHPDRAQALLKLAEVKYNLRISDEAARYCRLAQNDLPKDDHRSLANLYGTLADCEWLENRYAAAMAYLDTAYQHNDSTDYEQQLIYLNMRKGKFLITLENFEEAGRVLQRSRELAERYGQQEFIPTILSFLVEVAIGAGKADLASAYLDSLDRALEQHPEKTLMVEMLRLESKIDQLLGRHERAYALLDSFHHESSRLAGAETDLRIKSLELFHQIRKTQEAKAALEQQNTAQAERIRRQQLLLWTALLVAGIILSLLVFIGRARRRLKLANETISEQNHLVIKQSEILSQKNSELEELSQFRQDTMAMIVHDLKNPLNTIINLSKQALITDAGRRMLQLVHNILDTAKMESVKLETQPENTSLRRLFREVAEEIRFSASEKNIRIELEDKRLWCQCDPSLSSRALLNFASNAIKFSPMNGTIWIRAEQNGPMVRITVTDEGPGIAKHKQGKLFKKFSQDQAIDLGVSQSTGLGLAFCKLAAEAQGGQVGLESDQGQGACFFFTLPLGVAHPEEEVVDSKEPQQDETITMTELEEQILDKAKKNLQGVELFEISAIQEVLDQLPKDSTTLKKWKGKILAAVFAGNEDLYAEMLKT